MGIRLLDLRNRIAKAPRSKKGVRQYPAKLKEEVRAYAQQRVQQGVAQPRVAKELGLPKDTLYSWLRDGSDAGVEVGRRSRPEAAVRKRARRAKENSAATQRQTAASQPGGLPAAAIAFRSAVAALGDRVRTTPYPAELRAQAVSHLEERKASGLSMSAAARELGLSVDSLRSWTGEKDRADDARTQRSSVRAVNIVPETAAARGSSIVVHGPLGLRIEGLDIGAVATLVKELSCSA